METIKAHPYISVGAILLGGVAIYALMSGGGGGGSVPGVDPSSVAAATALQQTQMQVQGAISAAQINLQDKAAAYNATIELAKVQGKNAYDISSLQSTDVLAKINADQQVISLQSSLSAQTQQKAIDATVTQSQINANTAMHTTDTLANVLVTQSNNQMNTILGVTGINANVVNTQTQAQKDCYGFFASIFGC